MSKRGTGGFKRTTIEMPEDLHRRFKIRTVEDGTNMQRELIVMIESYVNRPKKKEKVRDEDRGTAR